MDGNPVGFVDFFRNIPDHRIERKKLHPVEELLLVTFCGVMAGCESWDDLELFGKTKLDYLMSRQLPFAAPAFMQNREKNQRKIIELIHNNEGAEKIASFIGLWISTPEHTRTPDEQKLIKEFQDATNGMIANIYTILTPQQKQRLHNKIQEYMTELGALTRKSQMATARTGSSLVLSE